MARRKAKKAKGVKVDFTGVEGAVKLADGDYHVTCEEVSMEKSDSGNDYLSWVFKTIEEEKTLFYNTSLQPQALWNLRNLLETLGVEVPDGPMDLDLKEMPGLEMVAVVENETYEGKKRPKIVDFMPVGEEGEGATDGGTDGGEEEEDEVPSEDEVNEMDADDLAELVKDYELDVDLKKSKTIRKKRAAVVEAMEEAGLFEEEGETYTEEDINGMKAKELKEVIDELELDVDLSKIKKLPKKKAAVIKAMEEGGHFEEGGEEEEEGDKLKADDVSGMDADELANVVKEYELDVTLKKFKTLRKKANAVIDALEEADMLEDED